MSQHDWSLEDPVGKKPNYLASPSANNRPTCRLCEAVHLNGPLRRSILAAYLGRAVSAWPPNYGLDMIAVLRHAWWAQRWERGRNLALCAVIVGVLVVLAAACYSRGDGPVALAVVLLVLLLVFLRRLLRRRRVTVREAFKWFRKWRQRHRALARRVTTLFLLCTLVFGWLISQLAHPQDAQVVLVGAVIIWGIGIVDAYVVAGRARRCRHAYRTLDAPHLRDVAPAMPDHQERSFYALGEGPDPDQTRGRAIARVIVYDLELRHDNEFIGSGESIWDVEYRVDTRLGSTGKDGKSRRPKRVDMVTLHRKLEFSMRKAGVPGLWCGYRMYVNGLDLFANDVLPEPKKVPVTHQPRDQILQYLRETVATRRTYLCVQVPVSGWDNEIIVTLFVRGQLIGDQLILHSKILILPAMIFTTFGRPEKNPNDGWTQLMHAIHFGTTKIWVTALGSPRLLADEAFAAVRRRWARWRIKKAVKHNREIRYGAIDSIREQLAVGGAVVTPNARQDIRGTIAFLDQTLAKAVRTYLVKRRIDTSSFDGFVQNIFNQHQNKIDQLNAKNVTFGSKSRAGDSTETGKSTPALGRD
ncbi:hypothetical protein [Plantactinospora sp. BC1]|uniref:hypothetical protein n=1 Tax=Plantactinospora sp. BC1 TaxID=2108470 RepID=UPI00131F0E3E|nr:hypothetical protein [Plantactinospora sp. BC1]